MEVFDIYEDIAKRTAGDIYVGVVGPVRSGKSTLVKKLTERLILPNISDKNKKKIALDETPQTAGGKAVMTTEPKFVPGEAVSVKIDKAKAKIKLIDCVGYMVDGAFFADEEGKPRMVKTPWDDEEMPFDKAAEIGTKKVISEHSTIGIVVTSDGSFTDIKREAYEVAEDRVIKELKSLNKPFIVLFNVQNPSDNKAKKEAAAIEKKYGVTAMPMNVESTTDGDIEEILSGVLKEFPIRSFDVRLPKWIQALPLDSFIVKNVVSIVASASEKIYKMKDVSYLEDAFSSCEDFRKDVSVEMDMAEGSAAIEVDCNNGLFYKVLSEQTGENMDDEFSIMSYVNALSVAKKEYERLRSALECAESTGYGITIPCDGDESVGEAEVVKKSGGYSVRIRASAKSLHIVRTDVNANVHLISGTKEQCEAFAQSVNDQSGEGLKTPIFGKPVYKLVNEGICSKCASLSDNVKSRIKRTLNKAINDKKANVICILI